MPTEPNPVPDDELPDGPELEQQDWNETVDADLLAEEIGLDEEPDGELPEEDDDNPYQDSDDALPDDAEERVISGDPSREGGHIDETRPE